MRRAHSVEQIRQAEADLMATLPPGALMQRASCGLAAACADLLGTVYGARVVVLAGSGNNGGDALFAAARLARRGARASALLLDPGSAHPAGLAAFASAGGQVVDQLPAADLVLDGIVGIGGSPGLRPPAQRLARQLTDLGTPVVAVDVPSGVGVDTGETPAEFLPAEVTVTFGTYKTCLLADPAAGAAGVVELVDIGLEPLLGEPLVEALQPDDVRRLFPTPPPHAHKYSRGVVGVAAGSEDYTGAGVLAVAGARHGSAGMVRYVGADAPAGLVRARFPDVVIGTGQVQAWVVGPGGGAGAGDALRRAVEDRVPIVVDADALAHLPPQLDVPALLTPHAGELARMLAIERAEVEARPLHFAVEAAKRWRATILLKGHRAVVASPGRPPRVNTAGNSWLATAGAGDVLAGLCGSLLASGLDALDAGSVGAWLHGAAATLAGQGGPLTAGQVAESLPAAVRAVRGSPW
jgi:ADP-dependent NAD(P)H-hydrate dehydratase / NAD(P)H-hydrate epimerase